MARTWERYMVDKKSIVEFTVFWKKMVATEQVENNNCARWGARVVERIHLGTRYLDPFVNSILVEKNFSSFNRKPIYKIFLKKIMKQIGGYLLLGHWITISQLVVWLVYHLNWKEIYLSHLGKTTQDLGANCLLIFFRM